MMLKIIVFVIFSVPFVSCTSYLSEIIKNSTGAGLSCINSLTHAINIETKIFEAWSSFRNDYKYGNSHDFGNFSICQDIDESKMSTQYCLIQYFNDQNPPISVPPKQSFLQPEWTNLDESFLGAVCLPSSCTFADVKKVVKVVLHEKNLRIGEKIYCRENINKNVGVNWGRILLYTSILSATIVLSNLKIARLKFLNILSDIVNSNQKANQATSYFDGIKAITMILIILDHAWYSRALFPFKNGKNSFDFRMNYAWTLLHTSNVLMEFYIIIGAVLTVKTLKKGFDNKKKLKWITKFYIKRFMRLFPVAILILFLCLTSNYENLAPFNSTNEKHELRNYWWTIFGYNFAEPTKFAMYSWFLSIYFQLTLLAPFIWMAFKSQKFGKIVKILVILTGVFKRYQLGAATYPHFSKMLQDGGIFRDDICKQYTTFSVRFLSFCVGMLLEEFLTKHSRRIISHPKLKLSLTFGVLLTFLIGFLSSFSMTAILDILVIFIFTFLLLLLYLNNGKIKKFLSLTIWMPISKMGLSIYLICSYIQFGIWRHQMEPLEIGNFLHFIFLLFKDFWRCAVPVFLTFVFVEEPFARLGEKIAEKI